MKIQTEEQAAALEELARAVRDSGPRPDIHRQILERQRREWPTLWRAIDRLLDTLPASQP